MRYSPLLISTLLIEPLRYFFSNYTKAQGLVWSPDEKERTIEIGTANDFHQVAWQKKPRILINRGGYSIGKAGLTDNMAQAKGIVESMGRMERTNQVWINGAAQIIIEAEKEGVCDLITDMVTHFIVWSRPLLCDTQGFGEFGLDMQVGETQPDKEDKEKFNCRILVPYRIEEHWQVNWDSLKIKGMLTTLKPYNPSPDQRQFKVPKVV